MDQIIIKSILIVVFVLFGIMLLRSGGSARTQAIRTLALMLFLAAAIVAVIFPGIVNELAVSVGIGRGADLLLYAFIIVFIGNSLQAARRRSAQDTQITQLARTLALQRPLEPMPAARDSKSSAEDQPRL
ncbi:DUF2304 domain-containing protein [Leucobacter coleopterorum]|uniref:DUF2304 domain-containing protein n=1 Tax=Leucobacter coleopterorum TaxID=2714933 RepID=A0ABX6K1Z3_9MICO|nr:DUF2304 domain-containing protein [Leucobacter coleopterorum]QIM19282.1 DUF2304 domain-containing protein [Leucobacter coleopterorum]